MLELFLDRSHRRHRHGIVNYRVIAYRFLLVLVSFLQVLKQIVHHRIHGWIVLEASCHLCWCRYLLHICSCSETREVSSELINVFTLALCDVRLLMGWLSISINVCVRILLCDSGGCSERALAIRDRISTSALLRLDRAKVIAWSMMTASTIMISVVNA